MLTFEELYVAYSPDVYRFSVWLCGNAADAEDITAETFTRAWTELRSHSHGDFERLPIYDRPQSLSEITTKAPQTRTTD